MNTMSSSTFSIPPSLLDKSNSRDRAWPTAHHGAVERAYPPPQPAATSSFAAISFPSNTLSPYSQIASSSTSPTLNNVSTPADSLSAFSEPYPPSDLSEQVDPFFGVDFNDDGSTPAFLDEQSVSVEDFSDHSDPFYPRTVSSAPEQNAQDSLTYPISPGLTTPSIHTTSPLGDRKSPAPPTQTLPPSRLDFSHSNSSQFGPEFTPGTNEALRSLDSTPSTTLPMPSPSPRVTVSLWGRDSMPEDTESPTTVRATGLSADDNFSPASHQRMFGSRDGQGGWAPLSAAGPGGWGPESRPVDEGTSINELHARHRIERRNQEVGKWITTSEGGLPPEAPPVTFDSHTVEDDGIDQREIPLGSQTENKPLAGQTYYTEGSGSLTGDDLKLMRQHPLWSDAPMMYRITQGNAERHQPESSKAAMERFEQMYHETGSVLSRAATWGTRRRSLPSIADMEGITSGSFLKKLSISRDRKPSILFKELRGLAKKPSVSHLLKRHRSVPEDEGSSDNDCQNRRESRDTLAPPSRTSSWTKRQQMPSLNTALVTMATGAAAIGTTHARTGSISNVTSPKSPFNLGVKGTVLRRPRSKSDLPKGGHASEESHPNLVGMWKKSGGPPVAHLARGTTAPDMDDEDEEDDEFYEESDEKTGMSNIIDEITPNFAGFKQQVLATNPKLAEQNYYLVDRIAHQQVVRYKALLSNKVKHMQQTATRSCTSGQMCIASGGAAIPFDLKGDSRGVDPLSATYDGGSDGDATPLEGAITTESFPPDIPLPPTSTLPAEFECQLCYSAKRFTKPSDWTKHVHEDVQPFTCTWDRCREPKIFKRKADWVRHENEGHRHLEWWTCDFEDCRHTCYRRDNFLQHLVREHKFAEPKVKTKAAVKRAGTQDPTWQRVEKCHAETMARPQDEPCRFCGKTLTTWKKLTVHLAKHMETLSLPVLRLVARKELDADTIISPIQEPPPRTFPPVKPEPPSFHHPPNPSVVQQAGVLAYPNASHAATYTYHHPPGAFSSFYNTSVAPPQPGSVNLGLHQPDMAAAATAAGFQGQAGYQNMPVSTDAYMTTTTTPQYISMPQQLEPFPAYMNALGLQDASGNQIYDTTGLDPTNVGDQQQYSHQGSLSPYSRSPHQGQGGFFHQQ